MSELLERSATNLVGDFKENNPRTIELHQQARQVLPGGVTHAGRIWDEDAPGVYIERAQGAYKWDVDGHRYIDYWMGHGALIMGHAHPLITQATADQLWRGTHFGANHELEIRWAELICKLLPSAQKVRFFSSGTEATMMAMRLSRALTGRNKVIKFDGRFHGWHDYTAIADSGKPTNGIPQAVADNMLVLPADLETVEKVMSADKDISAIIVEADGAHWGELPNPAGFLAGLREITRAFGSILIFDEIISGFRYSTGGIQVAEGVTPDLTTLAKIVAGGLPGGALAGRADLISLLDPAAGTSFIQHNGTYNANPLSATAGIAVLSMIAAPDATETIYKPIAALGKRLRDGMQNALVENNLGGKALVYGRDSVFHVLLGAPYSAELPLEGDITGTVFADYMQRPEFQQRLLAGMRRDVTLALRLEMDKRGVQFMRATGGFVSTAHTQADIDETIKLFGECVYSLKKGGLLD
jgi:glutamate-1-semialdehyde 2,1-aminomutase